MGRIRIHGELRPVYDQRVEPDKGSFRDEKRLQRPGRQFPPGIGDPREQNDVIVQRQKSLAGEFVASTMETTICSDFRTWQTDTVGRVVVPRSSFTTSAKNPPGKIDFFARDASFNRS